MGNLFAPSETPKQAMERAQRSIRDAVRDVERAQRDLHKKQEQRIAEMKLAARRGCPRTQMDAMAKDLIRMRNGAANIIETRTQLGTTGANTQPSLTRSPQTACRRT